MAFAFNLAPVYANLTALAQHGTTAFATDTAVSGSTFVAIVKASIGSPNGALPSSVLDSKGNVYTLVTGGIAELARSLGAYVCTNGVGGAGHTFTANFSPNNAPATILFFEITGAGAPDLATDAFDPINAAPDPRVVDTAAAVTTGHLVVFAGTSSFGGEAAFFMNDGSTIRRQHTNGATGLSTFVSTREAATTSVHTGSANMSASDCELVIFAIASSSGGSGGSAAVCGVV